MNILFVHNKPLDPLCGGIERITFVLMEGLISRGHNCFYLYDNGDTVYYENEQISSLQTFFSEKKIDLIIQQVPYSTCVVQLLRQKIITIPLIVVWHFMPFSMKKAWRVACNVEYSMKGKIKRIMRILFFPFFYYREKKRFLNVWHSVLSIITKVVSLSPNYYSDFLKHLPIEKKQLVSIPNPLTFEKCDENIIELLEKKEKIVLIVSRFHELQKRILYALKIWNKIMRSGEHNDWNLILVGHGSDELFYKNEVEKSKIPNVFFVGKQESKPYFEKASIYMMTSAYEGWPLALMEALQTGTVPVVMNSFNAIYDIIQDGNNGFIVPYKDFDAFVNKVKFIMNNEERKKEMAINGIKGLNKYHLDVILNQWESLLVDVSSNN